MFDAVVGGDDDSETEEGGAGVSGASSKQLQRFDSVKEEDEEKISEDVRAEEYRERLSSGGRQVSFKD